MIPATLLASHEGRLRARTLVAASFGIAALGLVVSVVRVATAPFDLGSVLLIVTVAVLASLPALQHWTNSYRVPAGVLIVLLLVTLPTYIVLLGVFPVPAMLMYPVVPMIAAFFLGRRAGLGVALVLSTAIVVLGSTLPQPDPVLLATLSRTFVAVAMATTLMSALLAWTYEGARERAEDELRSLNVALDEARQVAEAANRSKTEFLRNISHELRTPLNSVVGHSELLREDLVELGRDNLVADVTQISDASEHMLALINELLDISRIEAGGLELRIGAVDLAVLARSVVETMRPLVAEQHNVLTLVLDTKLAPVVSDGRRLRQVLLNLLGNACKFTERGEITLAISVMKDGAVALKVRDTGIGMTAEQAARIFLAFVQVDDSQERRDRGSGLGLAITRRLVELLGGTITVTSEPGRGSEFCVMLPPRALAVA
jgi:signal transduction histidine kinase